MNTLTKIPGNQDRWVDLSTVVAVIDNAKAADKHLSLLVLSGAQITLYYPTVEKRDEILALIGVDRRAPADPPPVECGADLDALDRHVEQATDGAHWTLSMVTNQPEEFVPGRHYELLSRTGARLCTISDDECNKNDGTFVAAMVFNAREMLRELRQWRKWAGEIDLTSARRKI